MFAAANRTRLAGQAMPLLTKWTERNLRVPLALSEKALYHQIHPAKLATDISTEIVSLYFLWEHQLWIGLATHFLPPIIASAILVPFGTFEPQKHSRFGRYISWHMTRVIEAIRLVGDIVMAVAAWYHSSTGIGLGLLIVIAAWGSGPFRHWGKSKSGYRA